MWCAEIVRQMSEEGLVACDVEAIQTAMTAAGDPQELTRETPHFVSVVIAQIRGLRLIESMASQSHRWSTKFGGRDIPQETSDLMAGWFNVVCNMYRSVHHRQPTADIKNSVVGEHGDLLWRALTETDHHGSSLLKTRLLQLAPFTEPAKDMTVDAALHNTTVAQQLTHGLFDGIDPTRCGYLRMRVRNIFRHGSKTGRYTDEQLQRIQEFIDIVDALPLGSWHGGLLT